ncbi:MAG TPA: hypothetical protein VF666_15485 [Pyrinomonadaceae bacterium]|jgi:hypothetical protein
MVVTLSVAVVPLRAQERREERGREAGVVQAGEVLVVLNEPFFNALLDAILTLADPPKFSLARGRGNSKCGNEIELRREALGTRTAVRFADGRMSAPVAFRGSYEAALVGCLNFEGWADTNFALAFDAERQVLTARIDVREVHLKNIPSLVSGGVTALVQESIDKRVNPVEILRAEQLAVRLPLTQGNTLRLRAREVRHEISGKDLRLRIFYEIVRNS